MPNIPQYTRETKLNGTPLPYEHYNLDANTSGASIAQAGQNISKGLDRIADAALRINHINEEMKAMEFNNAVENWKQTRLLDKENGYYIKTGKDAAGKTNELMKDYDDYVKNWLDENKVSRVNLARINAISAHKRTNILDGVTAHDLKQTNAWAATESKIGVDNAITSAVSDRNNPDAIARQISNIKQISRQQGELQNLDETSIQALEKQNVSAAYVAILETKIQEGDLSAKQFFAEHKEDIDPKYHAHYTGAIKREEDKYQARELANQIIASSKSEEDAIRKAEAIKDVNMFDSVVSRVKRHYSEENHFKEQAQKESLNNFYNKAVEAAQNGTFLSYDDIPDDLDPDVKLSLMNYVNTKGSPETDNQIWETLYEKSVNDAQGFAKEDLNKYRGFLSEGEFKDFTRKQEEIRAGKFYTNIKDDDAMIKDALKAIGLKSDGKQASAFSEIRALTRAFEARKGRTITDEELMNITNSLGYKGSDGVQLYKQLEKGMAARTGFIKDVMNDFVYYQNQHNGQFPPDDEKYKIIQNRATQKVQQQKTKAQETVNNITSNAMTMRNIAYTVPKPNEQKVLTYFADNQIPTLSEQLGLKLTVTDRYRNQAGSHHKEGRAADVSMSEHSVKNRIRIYQKLLALPTVQAIGTSDPNILTAFAGNQKIVDERAYDRQHGTNHVNHAHVTLINANPARPQQIVNNNGTYRF